MRTLETRTEKLNALKEKFLGVYNFLIDKYPELQRQNLDDLCPCLVASYNDILDAIQSFAFSASSLEQFKF